MLCQDYADRRWLELLQRGAHVRCLFLEPDGESIQSREREAVPGLPLCAVSLALVEGIEAVVGVIELPLLSTTYTAAKRRGARAKWAADQRQ
ncbi:DUF5919 domain-containing protein [Micromonospora sp. CA-263727]|uniref:DUF5919 domain-containing protein n=1 Tax=Micromonospora sp. CA-263727 TaxID=3239967 RepID=UPI003D8BBE24